MPEPQALSMVDGLASSRLLTRPFRGEPAIDREALADVLCDRAPRRP